MACRPPRLFTRYLAAASSMACVVSSDLVRRCCCHPPPPSATRRGFYAIPTTPDPADQLVHHPRGPPSTRGGTATSFSNLYHHHHRHHHPSSYRSIIVPPLHRRNFGSGGIGSNGSTIDNILGHRRRHPSGSGVASSRDGSTNDDDAGTLPTTPPLPLPLPLPLPPTDDEVESRTLSWIRDVVIGYGLCPFADRPLREGKLRLVVVRGNDDEEIASAVTYELVSRSEVSNRGTTIVISPEYHPYDFVGYMSLVQYLEEDVMDELNLNGHVQLAPFHPLFVFDGSGDDGLDNHTNRSPYPMFHVLREDEVSYAVDKLDGDAGKVWRRNVDLLERMEVRYGREGVVRAMTTTRGEGDAIPEGMDELLREVGERSSSSSSSSTSE